VIKNTEKSPYNDKPLKKIGKFAKMITQLRKKETGKSDRIIKIDNLKDARQCSALRQEDVRLKLKSQDKNIRRKGSVIWGVY
jgi:hypothetical protein